VGIELAIAVVAIAVADNISLAVVRQLLNPLALVLAVVRLYYLIAYLSTKSIIP
jgi:hypothetical protein